MFNIDQHWPHLLCFAHFDFIIFPQIELEIPPPGTYHLESIKWAERYLNKINSDDDRHLQSHYFRLGCGSESVFTGKFFPGKLQYKKSWSWLTENITTEIASSKLLLWTTGRLLVCLWWCGELVMQNFTLTVWLLFLHFHNKWLTWS